MKKILSLSICFVFVCVFSAMSQRFTTSYRPVTDSIFLKYSFIRGYIGSAGNYGKPQTSVASKAGIGVSSSSSNSYLIEHLGYTVSWNPSTCNPDWVSWILTRSKVNNAKYGRSDVFYPDPSLPKKYQVDSWEYAGSGYDRGHMCPAADTEYDQTAVKQSFFMSNVCPQVSDLNRRYWLTLESSCRKWAQKEDSLYITCGPYYNDSLNAIMNPKHKIFIPSGFFKVVMSLRKGHEKAIGFLYKNSYEYQSMQSCAVSVDSVETLTNIDFYPNVDATLQNRIEANYNLSDWE